MTVLKVAFATLVVTSPLWLLLAVGWWLERHDPIWPEDERWPAGQWLRAHDTEEVPWDA